MPGLGLQAIVGLGNPGTRNQKTRHNLGFRVVDCLAQRWNTTRFSDKFHSQFADAEPKTGRIALLKPQTFMNVSGQAVGEAARFYKWPVESILVLSDDLDIPDGTLRIRPAGGPGGHNGLKSLIEHLGTDRFPRVRIGIGRDPQMAADAYVLAPIPAAKAEFYESQVKLAADAVICILEEGLEKAMTRFHTSPPGEVKS